MEFINSKAFRLTALVITFLMLSACASTRDNAQNLSSSETVFQVILPEVLEESEEIIFEIVDNVTGIGINPTRYAMEKKDSRSAFIRIPISNDSVVNYRYLLRNEKDIIEKNASGNQVAYRTVLIKRPSIIKDQVDHWQASDTSSARGELSGFIYNAETDLPIADVIVNLNGNETISEPNGFFKLDNLPIGEFLLTAIHPDGTYEPFQQGAVVAQNALTPASFGLKPAEMVDVEFVVTVPENTGDNDSLRLVGNTLSTGNMFAEIDGGLSIIPSRAPLMAFDGADKYKLTIKLPAGSDFRYKFTLGNSFINAERSESGEFLTRQIIVPQRSVRIENSVFAWSYNKNVDPIRFVVSTPKDTPSGDVVSIQFNPYNWLPPIPMVKTGSNTWSYSLYGPFEYLEGAQFRFCRNDQCGLADDVLTKGANASGFLINFDNLITNKTITYTIENWFGLSTVNHTITPEDFRYDKPGFIKGLSFPATYNPYWLPYYEWGLIEAATSGIKYITISPTEVITNNEKIGSPSNLATTYTYNEISKLNNYAQEAGMGLILFPQLDLNKSTLSEYWSRIDTSYNGWAKWFETYTRFIMNTAYSANELKHDYLIIGGELVFPALPNGQFPDGTPSNTPYDMADRWTNLISEIQETYGGNLIFAIPDTFGNIEQCSFLHNVEAIMVVTDTALTANPSENYDGIHRGAERLLDENITSILQMYNKPIILGLQYGAIDGSATNCMDYESTCHALLSGESASQEYSIDLSEQADIYRAFYTASLTREWIGGIISLGYNPAVVVRDASFSVRGKPAMDVLSYYNNQIIQD